ncbi:DUF1592 domain-containing protein [Vibrio coralliilyticus]|uniref:DUF1592 domain-containing protein n=1 Tax=Vibrio coralliilyticus TaxID=190893 RepID=UPI001E5538AF|nr:DUF1592 domain-containing protein [Vibrio coralliilyticus]MCC2525587.1 DUF1588 domain-containing protein [Vibrio coralliilyticus]
MKRLFYILVVFLSHHSLAESSLDLNVSASLVPPSTISAHWNSYQITLENLGSDNVDLHQAELSFETPSALTSAPWGLQGGGIQLKSTEPHGSNYKNTFMFSSYSGTTWPLKPNETVTMTFGFSGVLDRASVEATFVFRGHGSLEPPTDESDSTSNKPEIEWVSPAQDGSTLAGETLVLAVTASDEDDDLVSVDFYADNTLVAAKTSQPYEALLTVSEGINTIYAEAKDSKSQTTRTPPLTLTAQTLASTGGAGSCSVPKYEHHGNYLADDKVQNHGQVYVCKQFGWCGQPAYEPGVEWYGNDYWTDAWTLEGPCSVSSNSPPVIDIILSSVSANTPFELQVSTHDDDGEVTRVEYYIEGLWFGESTQTPFSIEHKGLGEGSYNLFAVATDEQGVQSRSAAQTLDVVTSFEGNRLTITFPSFDHENLLSPPESIKNADLTGLLYCPSNGQTVPILGHWGKVVHIDNLDQCHYQMTLDSVDGYKPRFSPWVFEFTQASAQNLRFDALYRAPIDTAPLQALGGITVDIFHDAIYHARQMALGRDVVYVGAGAIPFHKEPLKGMVYAIELDPQTQSPVGTYVVAQGEEPHGVAYRNGTLYYSTVGALYKIDNIDENYKSRPEPVKVFTYPADGDKTPIPNDSEHWKSRFQHQKHPLKFNSFDLSDEKLYTAVGLPCNICTTPKEELYGTIFAIDLTSGEYEIIANGIRNAVGFDWHPVTGEIWFSDHNRQQFPNPDEINRIRLSERPHFGAPFFFGKATRGLTDCEMKNWEYMLHGKDVPIQDCDKRSWEEDVLYQLNNGNAIPPTATLPWVDYNVVQPTDYVGPEHEIPTSSAPLGVEFWEHYSSSSDMQHLIYATHASRPVYPALELRMVTIQEGTRVVQEQPLVTGWLQNLNAAEAPYECLNDYCIGRPVEFLEMPDGSLLVSDDQASVIYRLTLEEGQATKNRIMLTTPEPPSLSVNDLRVNGVLTYPNGHETEFNIAWRAPSMTIDNLKDGLYKIRLNDVADYIPAQRFHEFSLSGNQNVMEIALDYIEKPQNIQGLMRITAPAKPEHEQSDTLTLTLIDVSQVSESTLNVSWGESIEKTLPYGKYEVLYPYLKDYYPSPSVHELTVNESQLEHTLAVEYIYLESGADLFEQNCTKCHTEEGFDDPNKASTWSQAGEESLVAKILSMDVPGHCDELCAREIADYLLNDLWNEYLEEETESYGLRQVRLLTALEYANSVQDLLGVTIEINKLPQDKYEREFKFSGQSSLGIILPEDLKKYYDMAQIVSNTMSPESIGYEESGDQSHFVGELVRRVFRRPISSEELSRWTGHLSQYGVNDLVASLLLSPNFLYRHELGEPTESFEGYQLDQYELASALSYTFLGTTPSQSLLDQAENGQLVTEEQVRDLITSMIQTPRGIARFTDFIRYYSHTKVQELPVKPGLSQEVVDAMLQEQVESIRYLLTEGNGDIELLYNPDFTFVNGVLAEHYGIEGVTGQDFIKVDVESGQRGGILHQGLTQVVNSDYAATSLVKRGLMIRQHFLCRSIGVPVDVDPDDIELPSQPITTRQRWDIVNGETASAGQCWHCHQYMNDTGASLENYDAAGRWRINEAAYNDPSVTLPIDASGPLVDNTGMAIWLHFNNARDISAHLSSNLTALKCLADSYFRYATGHEVHTNSLAVVDRMTKELEQSGSLTEMLAIFATSQMFQSKKEEY